MSVRIRLRRMGAKKRPFYRIVVTDSREPRDGRYIESLGFYDPMQEPPDFRIEEEKLFEWLHKGAQPSEPVLGLLSRLGLKNKWEMLRRGEDVSGLEPVELKVREKKKKIKEKAEAAEREQPEEEKAAEKEEKTAPEEKLAEGEEKAAQAKAEETPEGAEESPEPEKKAKQPAEEKDVDKPDSEKAEAKEEGQPEEQEGSAAQTGEEEIAKDAG